MSFRIARDSVDDVDGVRAKMVTPVRHVCRAGGVGHEQDAFLAFRARERAHNCAIDMYTVRNDLRKDTVVSEHFPDNAGIAVRKAPHCIERVNRVANTAADSGARFIKRCIGVTHGDAHAEIQRHPQ